ncbi:MAG: MotA/TolQ/ExbB proton channel family protein [Deltaproteobacteria bacterium]|nr:MotA/TolQ/ExbB proton channel family protein [Deltaproteobacteria bacterium]
MSYTITQLAGFFLMAILLTAASLWGLAHGIEPLLANPQSLHDFFFHRSPIQWCTVTVFFFLQSVLVHRMIHHRFMVAGLHALAAGQPLQGKTIAAVVRQRFEKVRTCKKTDGPSAAASYGQDLARRDEEELERIYGFLNGATQLLLALGFLGTVWGISQSMFGAFGNLSGATTDHLKLLLENFSGALSTALDTTVLGIVCSVIVTLILTATQWAETSTLRALTAQVSSQLSLETALYNREGELWQKLQARCATLAEPLLRGIVEPLVQEMAAGMQTMVGQTLQLYDAKLGEIVQQHLARLQEHERQVADKLAVVLAEQMAAALQVVEAHGEQARVALIAELRRIGQQLYRMPEIAIRYPEQNGADADHH